MDVIGFHFYVTPKSPEAMVRLIEKVKRVMEQKGAGRKPLWNTETGWSDPKPFPSEERAAAYLARAFVLSWAAGVERFYWYAWDNHVWVSLRTTETDSKTLTAAGRAYETISRWLVGARLEGCEEDRTHTWVCRLERDGVAQWMVWNPDGAKRFGVPESWHATEATALLGAPEAITGPSIHVDGTPVLVLSQH